MSALDSSPFNDEYIEHHGILGMRWGIRRFQNKDGSLKPAGKKRYNDSDSEPRDRGLAPGANSGSKGSSTGKLAVAAGIAAAAGVTAASVSSVAKLSGKSYDRSYKNMSDEDLDKANKRAAKENAYKKAHNISDPAQDILDESKETISNIKKFRDADKVPTNNNVNRYNTRRTMSQKEMDSMSDQDLQRLVNRMNLETQYSRLTAEPEKKSRVDIGLERTAAVLGMAASAVTIGAAVASMSSKGGGQGVSTAASLWEKAHG